MEKGATFVGLDVHKDAINVAMLLAGETRPVEWQVSNDPAAVRRLVRKLQRSAVGEVRVCYEEGLPEALKPSRISLCQEIVSLSTRIEEIEAQLEALAKQIPAVARLRTVPGIGLLTATALYAFVGDISRFPSGRHMASFIGLTPREYSSGLRRRLGRISKRGDVYLRMLLIHGARSVLWHAKRIKNRDRLRAWALRLERKLDHNKAAVALAHKLARITWAVWKNDRRFEPVPELPAA